MCTDGGNSPLSEAILQNDLDIAHLLIANGALVNRHGTSGLTPFHVAIEERKMKMIRFCLQNGAEFYVETSNWRTNAFELALNCDEINIMKTLIHH